MAVAKQPVLGGTTECQTVVTIPAYRYSTMSLSRKLRFVLSFYGLMAEVRVEPYNRSVCSKRSACIELS
jgi:hypothetical protein